MKKKSGFTMFELLLMVIIISVGLSAIIITLTNGMTFIQKTRERTIAINLAREGIESVYQIRDTNRLRRGGQKDQCWLKKDPLTDTTNDGCSNDDWITSGNYILLTATTGGQQYFLLSGSYASGLNLDDGINTGDLAYNLCQNTGDNSRYSCAGQIQNNPEGKYFRTIKGIGLYNKDIAQDGGQAVNCSNGSPCNASALEFRFCSQVAYIGKGQGKVEFCGVLTNFSP